MAQQKVIQRRHGKDNGGRKRVFIKKKNTLKHADELFRAREYSEAIRKAFPLLERGVADAFFVALRACKELKDIRTAERIVRIGLTRPIRPELLYGFLSEVYLAADEIERYHKAMVEVHKIKREKEEALERLKIK